MYFKDIEFLIKLRRLDCTQRCHYQGVNTVLFIAPL
jgi:hypothetical protein